MKLLSVIHGPVYGGAHNQMIQLAGPLAAAGWDTVALVPDEPGSGADRLREAGIETATLPLHRLRASPNPLTQARFAFGLPLEVRAIRALIRDRGIDLVQPHGPTNPHAALAAHREGVPVVWQIYDTRAPMALRRLTMPLVVRVADVIVTWGVELARSHPGALDLGERLVTVFPPVDTRRFRPRPERRAEARAELNIPPDAYAIASVGNRNPSKGHEYLVRAAARLIDSVPDLHVRILGAHSPVHAQYEQRVLEEAKVSGLGDRLEMRDAGTRVADLLAAFDALVMTSVPRSEGIPTAILEAMACGLPVVTTRVGAVHELVDDGATGFIVPPEQPQAVADVVLRLAREPGLTESVGTQARALAVERYDLERCSERHLHAFQLAAAHRAAR